MKIYDYMTARAKQEGKRHTLPRKQYKRWIEDGVRCFFGVLVDEFGTPISDQQNTVFFVEWQALKKPASPSLLLR